ncbi:hypothetical protein PINS_up007898 [Pythium insidiosum]|nr:hypothetical protein PINS_up007898 [Pythium insidiosum]
MDVKHDQRKRKRSSKTPKLNPGWRPGRKKRRRQLAATMIQKCFRSYLLRKAFKRQRNVVAESFQALRAFHHARDRQHWRKVDLRQLSREELRLIALSLNLPSTGKKVLLLGRVQRWVDQNVLAKNLAIDAAARAQEKQSQGTCDRELLFD